MRFEESVESMDSKAAREIFSMAVLLIAIVAGNWHLIT